MCVCVLVYLCAYIHLYLCMCIYECILSVWIVNCYYYSQNIVDCYTHHGQIKYSSLQYLENNNVCTYNPVSWGYRKQPTVSLHPQ